VINVSDPTQNDEAQLLFLFLSKHFYVICYIILLFSLSDGIASLDHLGFKSNELLKLKQGLRVDISDAKLNELLTSNNLDVSNKILNLFVCLLSIFLLFWFLPSDNSFDFYMYMNLSYCHYPIYNPNILFKSFSAECLNSISF